MKLLIQTARRNQLSLTGEPLRQSAVEVMSQADRASRSARAGTSSGIGSPRLGLLIGAALPEVDQVMRVLLDAKPLARIALGDIDEQTFAGALVSGRTNATIACVSSILPTLHSQHIRGVTMSVDLPADRPLRPVVISKRTIRNRPHSSHII